MPYGYIGTLKTTSGHRDDVLSILLEGVDDLPAAGCAAYIVSTSDADADLIHVVEVWESKEHHEASLRLPAVRESIERAMPMLTGEFTSEELRVVGGLGLGGADRVR